MAAAQVVCPVVIQSVYRVAYQRALISNCLSYGLFKPRDDCLLQQFKSKQHMGAPTAPAVRTTGKPASMSRSIPTQNVSHLSAQQALLHPSWAAKQKQKQALLTAAPAGRKTVFSESDQSVVASVPHADVPPVKSAKPAGQRPAVKRKGPDKAEALHPSWAAKRAAAAQKVDLTSAPTAHKIVFED